MTAKKDDAKAKPKSSKKKIFLALAIVPLLAALGIGLWVWIAGGEQERIVLAATESVDALFTDNTHENLAFFSSCDVYGTENAFADAREDVARVNNIITRTRLSGLIDRAEDFWSIQLEAHELVEALFCECEGDCPWDMAHECYPRQDNTLTCIEEARQAVRRITTAVTRGEKTRRVDMAGDEIELVSTIRERIAVLTGASVTEEVLDEIDEKIEGLLNATVMSAFSEEVQVLRDALAARVAAAEEAERAAADAARVDAARRQNTGSSGSYDGSGATGSGGGSGTGGSAGGGMGGRPGGMGGSLGGGTTPPGGSTGGGTTTPGGGSPGGGTTNVDCPLGGGPYCILCTRQ